MSNIIDSIQLSGTVYTISGGGSTYTAGRAIDITNDTISLDLPISAGTGTNSIREGNSGNIASGNYSHAEGQSTSATSNSSHAEGVSTLASGSYSHAEGQSTSATSNYSHAEGGNTTASGNYSHAEGNGTIASGNSSHAEGQGTLASGSYSHAEGAYTTASGYYSHAEGSGTLASNYYSHAEGANTIASGSCSHSEGNGTMANGVLSHAEGGFTNANNQSEHASGQFNISSSASTEFGDSGNTLFSVGNGTADNARHNAFEIRQNADIYIVSGGTDIKLQDHLGGGGNATVELTQAEYDALVSAGTVSANTYYIITDAYVPDISAITTAITSGSTDSEIPTAKAVYTAIPTVTNTITSGSNDAITSGAVYDAIGDIETLLAAI